MCFAEADSDAEQEMGDPAKVELSEEEQEAFADKRSEALAAFSEGEWQKAIDLVRLTIARTETQCQTSPCLVYGGHQD